MKKTKWSADVIFLEMHTKSFILIDQVSFYIHLFFKET